MTQQLGPYGPAEGPAPTARRLPLGWVLAIATLTAAFLILWFFAGRGGIQQAGQNFSRREISHVVALFEQHREQSNRYLRLLSRVLADGPRLKATVDTPGIDEGTLKDILSDLEQQTHLDLLAVLTPAGRVKAVVGAENLRGLDLSGSALIKSRDALTEGASGVWVMGDQVLDISAIAVRAGDRVVGYILVGAVLSAAALEEMYRLTGFGVAVVVGDKVASATPRERSFQAAFEALAAERSVFTARNVAAEDGQFVASVSQIGTSPTLARIKLIWLCPVAPSMKDLHFLSLLLFWVPLAYTVLLAAVAIWLRSPRG